MKTTMKRFFSGMMALSLAFGGTNFVYADTLNGTAGISSPGSITLTPDFKEPTIKVEVPTANASADKIMLNPFNMGGDGQIYSPDYTITNKSNIPISVSLVATVDLSQTITLAQKAPSATGDKQAMINLSYTDGTGKTTASVIKTIKEVTNDNPNTVPISTAMAPLGGNIVFGFKGSTTVSPTKDGVDDPWASTDTISAVVAYKFTPNAYAEYSVTKSAVLYASDLNKTYSVAKGTTAEDAIKTLPTHILGDGKVEVGVTWKCDTYAPDAPGSYTFTAIVADSEIYNVSTDVEMPTVTVTVKES